MRVIKNSENLSDAELIEKYANSKDQEYLGVLFKRYMALVYGVCLKYLQDREQAKDAVIQVYEQLIIQVLRFNIENFKTWLYVITKNHCLMILRKEKSENKNYQKFVQDSVMEIEENIHPLDKDDTSAIGKALKDCLRKLNQSQLTCVVMFYYRNRSYREIAEKLNDTEKSVKSFIQNGKRNLKICLEKNHAAGAA